MSAGIVLALAVLVAPSGAARSTPGFASPVYVDAQLAGGEPAVIADPRSGTLIYAAHAGETHTDAAGLLALGTTTGNLSAQRDQVLMWTSRDSGRTWKRLVDVAGFAPSPTATIGFSDPDLAVDAGGRVYGTAINPGPNGLFSTADAGATWTGTPDCHEGDRPFLAAGRAGQAFLVTGSDTEGQVLTASLDGGASCQTTSVAAAGSATDPSTWQGAGKPVYDPAGDALLLGSVTALDTGQVALGVARLDHPGTAWPHPPAAMTPGGTVARAFLVGRWPSVAVDDRGTVLMAWDAARTAVSPSCALGSSVAPSVIQLAVSHDHARTWSAPVTLARPRGTALWPWVVAGRAGRAFVAWYEYDQPVNPYCAGATSALRVRGAFLDVRRGVRAQVLEVSGRPVHRGALCSGVGCIALGEDRRMGDLFTASLDARGCVLVATGDTMALDPTTGQPAAWSHPVVIRQDRGPSLTTGAPCRA